MKALVLGGLVGCVVLGSIACGGTDQDDSASSKADITGSAKVGEACRGDGDAPIATCADGLECYKPSDTEAGKCRKPLAKVGEACGGNGDEPIAICGDGLECYEPTDVAPGKCLKQAKLGEACGGNGDDPIAICAYGLECYEPSDLEPGKCRAAQ